MNDTSGESGETPRRSNDPERADEPAESGRQPETSGSEPAEGSGAATNTLWLTGSLNRKTLALLGKPV
jgi:hypothetical protein